MTEFESLTARLYEQVSRPNGEWDWDSVRELFHPKATLVRTGLDESGERFALVMTLDEYIENAAALLVDVQFREVELHQQVDEFGNVARLASVYESEFKGQGRHVKGRGVNFFNLVNTGSGWQVINMVWDNERKGLSLEQAGLMAGACIRPQE